jgi:hypothetical protein
MDSTFHQIENGDDDIGTCRTTHDVCDDKHFVTAISSFCESTNRVESWMMTSIFLFFSATWALQVGRT